MAKYPEQFNPGSEVRPAGVPEHAQKALGKWITIENGNVVEHVPKSSALQMQQFHGQQAPAAAYPLSTQNLPPTRITIESYAPNLAEVAHLFGGQSARAMQPMPQSQSSEQNALLQAQVSILRQLAQGANSPLKSTESDTEEDAGDLPDSLIEKDDEVRHKKRMGAVGSFVAGTLIGVAAFAGPYIQTAHSGKPAAEACNNGNVFDILGNLGCLSSDFTEHFNLKNVGNIVPPEQK